MSITKIADRKYKVCVNYTVSKGCYKRITRIVHSLTEAKKKEQEILDSKRNTNTVLFHVFINTYLEDLKARVKYSTYYNVKSTIELKILPYFGDFKLCEINGTIIHKWKLDLIKRNNSKYTIYFYESIFRTVMLYAIKFYDVDPVLRNSLAPIVRRNRCEMQIWTIDEFKKAFKYTTEDTLVNYGFKMLILTAFLTGARSGELLALTREDIDFGQKVVHITKTYKNLNHGYCTSPKSKSSIRDIAIPMFLLKRLDKYISVLPRQYDRIFGMLNNYSIRVKSILVCKLIFLSESYCHTPIKKR